MLFEPFKSQHLELKNRVVMSAMTRSRGDVPNKLHEKYYAQRSSAGLIVTESNNVSPMARGYLWTPGLYTGEHIEGWNGVTQQVHKQGGTIFAQLMHAGRISHTSILPSGNQPQGVSDVQADATCFAYDEQGNPSQVACSVPVPLSQDGIKKVIGSFQEAAANAMQAGFDGIELLAANGFLFDQFFDPSVNTRTDQYGNQSFENRARFLLEVVDSIRNHMGKIAVGIKLSPNGQLNGIAKYADWQSFYEYLLTELSKRDLAYVLLANQGAVGVGEGYDAKWGSACKTIAKNTLILNGGYDAEKAQEMIIQNRADLIAFARPFIANSDLVQRLKVGSDLNEVDYSRLYGGGEEGYTDYPILDEIR